MNEVHVRVNERGFHVPYRRVNGVYAMDIGPAFRTPREAIDYANRLESMPSVSPLRASSGVVSPTAPTPHAGAVGVEATPDVRRRASGRLSG